MKFQTAALISSAAMMVVITCFLSTPSPLPEPTPPHFNKPNITGSSPVQNYPPTSLPRPTESAKSHTNPTSFIQQNRDYRVVFENLLANKTELSGLYTRNIIVWCNGLRSIDFQNLPASASNRQDRARLDLESLCATFTDEELSSDRLERLSKDSRTRSRFVDLLDDRHQHMKTQEGKRSAFKAALEEKDPLLLEEIFSEQFINQEGVVYFNGTEYRQRYAPTVSYAAWRSATCEGTYTTCGPQDRIVLELCAVHGSCVDSRRDAYREIIRMTGSSDEVELYDRLYTQFVDAIRLGNVEAFIRK